MIKRTRDLEAFELRRLGRRLERDKHLKLMRALYRAVREMGGFRHGRTRAQIMEKAAFARAINGLQTHREDRPGA
jgi:hypothetical protein